VGAAVKRDMAESAYVADGKTKGFFAYNAETVSPYFGLFVKEELANSAEDCFIHLACPRLA
jgi:hypothetical protein